MGLGPARLALSLPILQSPKRPLIGQTPVESSQQARAGVSVGIRNASGEQNKVRTWAMEPCMRLCQLFPGLQVGGNVEYSLEQSEASQPWENRRKGKRAPLVLVAVAKPPLLVVLRRLGCNR